MPETAEQHVPTEVPAAALYTLKAAEKRYGEGATQVVAVAPTNLEIRRGEYVAIVGPSGSGKTTVLQLLGALDRPSAGEVLFEDNPLARMGDAELARLRRTTIGFIFQQFNLIPTLTARQNVEVALAPTGPASGERRRRADELLAEVGLAPRAEHLPSELSGGEQQRVAIARALAERAARAPGRRAHRQPRHRHGRRGHGVRRAPLARAGAHGHPGHARPRHRRASATRDRDA